MMTAVPALSAQQHPPTERATSSSVLLAVGEIFQNPPEHLFSCPIVHTWDLCSGLNHSLGRGKGPL